MKKLFNITVLLGAVSCAHSNLEKEKLALREHLFALDKEENSYPEGYIPIGKESKPNPKVEGKIIETKIKGRVLIEKHRQWTLEKGGAKWIKLN